MKKFWLLTALLLVFLCLTGCYSEKPLTAYFGDSAIVSVRYFNNKTEDGPVIEVLDPARIPEYLECAEGLTVQRYSFHTDYFWGGWYGIEMETEDGKYICYDGTRLICQSASVLSDEEDITIYDKAFLEVTNGDFWETMKILFPDIRDVG